MHQNDLVHQKVNHEIHYIATKLQNLVGRKLAGASVFAMRKKLDVADMLHADMAFARSHWFQTFIAPLERTEGS